MNATQIDGSSTLDEDLDETITSIDELQLDSSSVSDCDTDNEEFTKMMCDLCEKCYSDETLFMEHRLLCHGDSLDEYGEPTEEMYPKELVDQLDGYPGSPSEISDGEDQGITHGNSDAEMRDVSEEHPVANVSFFL